MINMPVNGLNVKKDVDFLSEWIRTVRFLTAFSVCSIYCIGNIYLRVDIILKNLRFLS